MALCSISGEVLLHAFSLSCSDDQPTTGASERVGLSEQQKKSRDELLEELQLDVHDVHANVRARAVSVLNSLNQSGLVPLSQMVDLLHFVAPSINDVSSNVRKNVIQFFSLFLAIYPFTFRVNYHQLLLIQISAHLMKLLLFQHSRTDLEDLLKCEKLILQKILEATNKDSQQSATC